MKKLILAIAITLIGSIACTQRISSLSVPAVVTSKLSLLTVKYEAKVKDAHLCFDSTGNFVKSEKRKSEV